MESVVDVLEELALCGGSPGLSIPLKPEPRNRLESVCMSLGEPARRVLHGVGHDPVTMDQLVAVTGMTAGGLAPILLKLELDGWVESLPGHRFVRAVVGSDDRRSPAGIPAADKSHGSRRHSDRKATFSLRRDETPNHSPSNVPSFATNPVSHSLYRAMAQSRAADPPTTSAILDGPKSPGC